ncbi:CRP-like cAMP-binding protein [Caulobacter ginsengisoli]|uniref:CRP-like cAMP-binding protein n=1 Tax=Caulobacter ginsengisoli TaxID=400775 RepID=A0ABU0IK99_9CAUL|nr:hypothetical protein [Caulobacter ginsengisoli]MDQ0462429.1 CRP-like cAMP-binding protein [Caulobacter ginsengisoli]
MTGEPGSPAQQWAKIEAEQHRLVFRPAHDYVIRAAARLAERHGGDLVQGFVWLALLQACRGAEENPPWTPRPAGPRPLARSLNLPYETVRRKLKRLEAQGLCVQTEDGAFTVDGAALNGPERRALADVELAVLRTIIQRTLTTGVDLLALAQQSGKPAAPSPDPALSAQALTDSFLLRMIEVGGEANGDIVDTYVLGGLNVLNAEVFTYDAELARRYARPDTPPEEGVRAAVTIARLAAELHLPRETVRRRMLHFESLGWVERIAGGYQMSMARMQQPQIMAVGGVIARQFVGLLAGLRQVGAALGEAAPDVEPDSGGWIL